MAWKKVCPKCKSEDIEFTSATGTQVGVGKLPWSIGIRCRNCSYQGSGPLEIEK